MALLCCAVQAPYATGIVIAVWVQHGVFALMAWDDQVYRILLSFNFYMWTEIQWQFAFYYLRTACLFKVTMSCFSDEHLEPVEKREKILELIYWSVQGF